MRLDSFIKKHETLSQSTWVSTQFIWEWRYSLISRGTSNSYLFDRVGIRNLGWIERARNRKRKLGKRRKRKREGMFFIKKKVKKKSVKEEKKKMNLTHWFLAFLLIYVPIPIRGKQLMSRHYKPYIITCYTDSNVLSLRQS